MVFPMNDLFANATEVVIPTIGATYTSLPIDVIDATGLEVGEPANPAGGPFAVGGKTVWWKYTPTTSGNATFHTNLSVASDTEIGLYTGASVDALTRVAGDSDTGDGNRSILTFACVAGTTYYLQVGNYNGGTGSVTVQVTGPAALAKTSLQQALTHSPIGAWSLGDAPGATFFDDASVNARDMPLVVTTGLTLGRPADLPAGGGTAAGFDATSTAHAALPFDAAHNAASLTCMAWVRLYTTTGGTRAILSRERRTTNRVFQFRINGNVVEFLRIFTAAGGNVLATGSSAPTLVSDGKYHHVAATYDGTNIKILVDGGLQTTTAAAGGIFQPTADTKLAIGADFQAVGDLAQQFFRDGDLRDVAYFGTALTEAQIKAIYEAGHPYDTFATNPNVLLQDRFNRDSSTTLLGIPPIGGPYTVRTGTWGIINNEAYLPSLTANAHVTFPAAINLDISVKVTVNAATQIQTGLTFRWLDINNHWLLQHRTPTTISLYRCVAGVYTEIANIPAFVLGDVIGVKAYDEQIGLYRNGQQHVVLRDQWFSSATATAGLRNGGTATARWEDLMVRTQTTPLNALASTDATAPTTADLLEDATFSFVPALYKGRDTAIADESEIP